MNLTSARWAAVALGLALALGCAVTRSAAEGGNGISKYEAAEGFVTLFDGKTLKGWEGDPAVWGVKDGVIVGRGAMLTQNNFLAAAREYGDFILRLQVRLVNNEGNTGVQFRSVKIAGTPMMSGFQADYANVPQYCGMLYDEKRRGILVKPTEEKITQAANKPGDWNDLEIAAQGDRIAISLNGVQTVAYVEKDSAIPRTGLIGLQTHAKTNMEVQFRNIRIKELSKR
ncbi:MAG: DUF1080 domain-containing protein [bacterium]|nr:DUF1080 domain-containing protein [bacterium]